VGFVILLYNKMAIIARDFVKNYFVELLKIAYYSIENTKNYCILIVIKL